MTDTNQQETPEFSKLPRYTQTKLLSFAFAGLLIFMVTALEFNPFMLPVMTIFFFIAVSQWFSRGRYMVFKKSWPFFFWSVVPAQVITRERHINSILTNPKDHYESVEAEIARTKQAYGEDGFLYVWQVHGALLELLRFTRQPDELVGLTRQEAVEYIFSKCPTTFRMAELTLDHLNLAGILTTDRQDRYERGRTAGETEQNGERK